MDKMVDIASEIYWTNEHLTAISEMKIIYLYKSFEIKIKSLIKAAYPNVITKGLFKWENMVEYFKSLGMIISSLDGYQEVNDLRKVNNTIKHTHAISDNLKTISEFNNLNEFTFFNIDSFYERVKPKIQNFSKLLEQQILKDLFIFDDYRIEKIATAHQVRHNLVA